jgi:ribosomal protein L21E
MPGGQGLRHRTRDLFQRGFRQKGFIPLTTYLRVFKFGDYVDVRRRGGARSAPALLYALRALPRACCRLQAAPDRALGGRGAGAAQPRRPPPPPPPHLARAPQIKMNPAVQKGMAFKWYHGKTGVVWNVTKRAVGVEVNKQARGPPRGEGAAGFEGARSGLCLFLCFPGQRGV